MIKQLFPEKHWPAVRRVAFEIIERGDRLFGKDPLIPPRVIQYVGGKNQFIAAGEEFFAFFKTLGGLKTTDNVLDIGCGMGRMAMPLTRYLEPPAFYRGFDIVKHAIDWCERRYSQEHPHFKFDFVDVQNRDYNPQGQLEGGTFRFPYADATFDFAFATSVFTHLLPPVTINYLKEARRVLKPNGRVLFTFLVLDDEARDLISKGKSRLPMSVQFDGFLSISRENPEAAVGYPLETVRAVFEQAGLKIKEIHSGNWCGRRDHLTYQDVVVAVPSLYNL